MKSNSIDGTADDAGDDSLEEVPVFQKFNKHLHGEKRVELLSSDFLKKFIQFVKARRNMPKLTDDVSIFSMFLGGFSLSLPVYRIIGFCFYCRIVYQVANGRG